MAPRTVLTLILAFPLTGLAQSSGNTGPGAGTGVSVIGTPPAAAGQATQRGTVGPSSPAPLTTGPSPSAVGTPPSLFGTPPSSTAGTPSSTTAVAPATPTTSSTPTVPSTPTLPSDPARTCPNGLVVC